MHLPPPQASDGEFAAAKGARVEIEPPRPDVRFVVRGMTMHDEFRQRHPAVEKTVADEHQILVRLCCKRPRRIDAGMDEQDVRRVQHDRHRPHEIDMRVRQRMTEEGVELRARGEDQRQMLRIEPIGFQRLRRPDPHPVVKGKPAVDIIEHSHLVVAGKADPIESFRRRLHEVIDDLRRFRAAVDIVAEHHDQLAPWQPCRIPQDRLLGLHEQITPAVNIADGIGWDIGNIHCQTRSRLARHFRNLAAASKRVAHHVSQSRKPPVNHK
ncbi:hypothetical protein RHECNPAF_3500098 [Rhizobium etli CNPAF512]|nr:hypothetical protein RHECNPAF_3500098 [Rhizobium etli CNPAF512]